MTVSTLRPDGTGFIEGLTVTGAANAHSALSDDSDSSYVSGFDVNGDHVSESFGDLSLPAGAVIRRVDVRFRSVRTSAGTSSIDVTVVETVNGKWFDRTVAISHTAITTHTAAGRDAWPSDASFTDAEIDALYVTVAYRNASSAAIRLHELYVDVTYVEKPELTVTSPSGTVTDTNLVAAAWTPDLDPDGGAQTHFEVAVTADGDDPDADPRLVESGVVASSATSWQASEPLADGSYDVHVRVAQTVNGELHWSDWEKEDFAISVNLPAAPTLTLTPQAVAGRVQIDLDANSGDATTDGFQVQWSHDNGVTWTNLRTPQGFGIASGTDVTLYDHEAPNGKDVIYRARAGHVYSAGPPVNIAWSDWVQDTTQWSSGECWLKHPTIPTQNLKIRLYAYGEYGRAPRHAQMQPLGSSSVIIAADKRGPRTGNVTFYTPTEADRDALDTLLDDNPATPFLLQTGAADKRPDRWVVFGQHDTAFIVDKAWVDDSHETLGWVEVPRP